MHCPINEDNAAMCRVYLGSYNKLALLCAFHPNVGTIALLDVHFSSFNPPYWTIFDLRSI